MGDLVPIGDVVKQVHASLGVSKERAERMVRVLHVVENDMVPKTEVDKLSKLIVQLLEKLPEGFNPDTKLPIDEAVDKLKGVIPEFPEKNIKAMFLHFDRDNSNTLDIREFLEFYVTVKIKKAVIEDNFKLLDIDNSNDLDAKELVRFLMTSCNLEEFMAYSLVSDFDKNKDGKLDKKEFLEMWLKLFGMT